MLSSRESPLPPPLPTAIPIPQNPQTDSISTSYIPWTEEKGDITACGIPINYYASKEWADKKVVVFALPGAFTPVCSARHVPEYIEKLPELRAKGVDAIAVLAYNDAYVMSAWGKANGVTGDDIVRPRLSLCWTELALIACSSSSLTLRPSSPRALAGLTLRAALVAMPSSLTTARSPTLPLRGRRTLLRYVSLTD